MPRHASQALSIALIYRPASLMMAARHACTVGLLATLRLVAATEFAPVNQYLSRPDLKVPRLFVDSYNDSAAAPGYLFMSPFYPELHPGSPIEPNGQPTVNFHAGPMIYDNSGVIALVSSACNPVINLPRILCGRGSIRPETMCL